MLCAGFSFGNSLAIFSVALNRFLSPLPLFFRLCSCCLRRYASLPFCLLLLSGFAWKAQSGEPQAFWRRIGSVQNL